MQVRNWLESLQIISANPCRSVRFMEFQSERSFAGIWACASLLHVPSADLSHTLTHLAQYLDSDGMFYCSFKHGTEDRELGGRHLPIVTKNGSGILLNLVH